ncbi:MAG TPA: glycosyltransferase family 1 protein, partial [bacterium]|nr:glycosyltransferase family 1 protein [bacterium]
GNNECRDLPGAGNFRQVRVPGPASPTAGTLLDLSPWLPAGKIDLYHSLIPLTPLILPCPSVVTLHDFQPLLVQRLRNKYPEFESRRAFLHQKTIDLFYRFTYRRALSRARGIICISRHTADRLKILFPETAGRDRVVYYGLEKKFRPIERPDLLRTVRETYSLPERFLFYAGTNRPNKDLPRLLDAVKLLLEDGPRNCPDLRLVAAGFEHPAYPPVMELARARGIADRVLHVGEVSHDRLPLFYNLADAAVLVSFLEGFGFPPLEALACGTPVVAARDSSLPEVVGDAGVMVDPLDIEDIARGIFLLWSDAELRREYSRRGRERALLFDWDRAGRETVRFYTDILSPSAMPV